MVATRTSRKKKEGLTEEELAVLEVEEYEKRMKDITESPKKQKRNPFSSSSTSSPSSSSLVSSSDGAFHLPALDGIRVLCTVWLIVFHTAYFSVTFLTKEQWKPWFYDYNGFIFNGLQGVDVFFVLTGLLLSYPLFYRHSSAQPISISWRSFVWRRLVRILPSYCVAIGFFCFVLTRNGEQHKLAAIPSTGIQMMLHEHYPGIDHVPSNCFLSGFNLLFLNNWLPFGGCMGWTWSLAIQVQFYVLFPLLVLLFKTPKRLALLMLVLWVTTHLFRHWLMETIMARYNFVMFLWDNADRESFYMYFTAWYANSFARMHCIFSGVLLAYSLVHPLPFHFKPTTFFKENALVRRCCSLLSLFVLHQTFFSSDLKGSTRPNMLYTVGGPVWLTALCYQLLILVSGIGIVASSLRSFLSLPIFSVFANATFGAYLVHPALIIKAYLYMYAVPMSNVPTREEMGMLWCGVLLASFGFGFVLYYLVEKPVACYLQKKKIILLNIGKKD